MGKLFAHTTKRRGREGRAFLLLRHFVDSQWPIDQYIQR